MPIKKGKKKVTKQKQKQKQSQVQKVVVNINKPTSKQKSTKRDAKVISKSYSSYTTPIYQSSPIAYPSYQRQAEAIPVTIPISSGRTLGAEPSNKLVSENLLKSELSDIYASDKYDFFVAENPLLKKNKEKLIIDDSPTEVISNLGYEELPEQEATLAKRSYVKKKTGPRRNSLEDLVNRYYAIKGENPPLMKATQLKSLVEELESRI